MQKTRKKRNAAITAAIIVLLVIASMFAWGTYQSALNEFIGTSNPDAELVDEFDPDVNQKDVYVKNTGDVPFVARIRLREFMAIGSVEGAPLYSILNGSEALKNNSPPPEFNITEDQWSTHGLSDGVGIHDEANDPFCTWWDWLDENAEGIAHTMCTYQWWAANGKPTEVWVLCDDGYFYYSSTVAPDSQSTQILSGVAPKFDAENYYYAIDVGLEVLTLRDLGPWFDTGGGISTNGIEMDEASDAGKEIILSALAADVTAAPSNVRITPSTDQAVALNGDTRALTIAADANGAPSLAYQWFVSTSADGSLPASVGTNAKNFTPPSDVEGTFYYFCLVTNTKGSTVSPIVKVVVIDDPDFGTPKSLGISGDGEIALLEGDTSPSVTAQLNSNGGKNLKYQWFVNSVDDNIGGTAVSGAVGPNFAIPTNTPGQYYYYFTVTSSNGDPTTSPTVKVVVVGAPTSVSVGPNTAQVATLGSAGTVQLTVSALGGYGDDVYQWYVNTVNSNTGGDEIADETDATFTPPTTTSGEFYYYATIAKTYNPTSAAVASNVVKVTILEDDDAEAKPSNVNITPSAEQNIVFGNSGNTLTANANLHGSTAPKYQWYSNTTNSTSSGTAIGGATSSTYVPQSATRGTVFYYVIVSNSKGSTTSSNVVRINFDDGATAAPTAVLVGPPDQTIGYNASIVNTVTATVTIGNPGTNNATLKYQWYKAISGATTVGSTLLEGETASTLSPDTSAEGMFYYYVVVSNSKAPAGIASNIVTVTVGATSAPSGVGVTPDDQLVIEGDPATPLTANVSNTGGAAPSSIAYQWYSRTTNSNAIEGATIIDGAISTTFTPPSDTKGILYYFCVATNMKGSTASNTVKVEVVPFYITLDGINWRVLAVDTTTPGGPYQLITTLHAVAGTSVYNSGSDYIAYADQTTGGVREAVNNWYAGRGNELKSRAHFPSTLVSDSAYRTVTPAAITAPAAAAGAATTDVAFLLSYTEALQYFDFGEGLESDTASPDRVLRDTSGIAVTWWLRSPGGSSTRVGRVNTVGSLVSALVAASDGLRPALWIK